MTTCKECGWWRQAEQKNQTNGTVQGRCIVKSPSVTAVVMPVMNNITREVTPQILEVTSWPLIAYDNEACGDYKPALHIRTIKGCNRINEQ